MKYCVWCGNRVEMMLGGSEHDQPSWIEIEDKIQRKEIMKNDF